jgi:hypothetical protein
VTADPPSLSGANQDTDICPLPATPDASRGADGTVRGVTADEACDATESPAAFAAVTVNV